MRKLERLGKLLVVFGAFTLACFFAFSNLGMQSQSTLLVGETSARTRPLPITPWSSGGYSRSDASRRPGTLTSTILASSPHGQEDLPMVAAQGRGGAGVQPRTNQGVMIHNFGPIRPAAAGAARPPAIIAARRDRVRRLSSIVAGAFRYVVFGNLFLAASAAAWAYSTYRVLGLPRGAADYDLLGLVFGGVVVVYALDRLYAFDRAPERPAAGRLRWVDEHRRFLLGALLLACAGVAVLLFFVNAAVLGVLGALGAVSFAYSLPVLRNFTVGLKDVGLSKVFLIALVWTCVTVLLPPLEAGAPVLTRDVVLLFAERFLFVFAISLPFDIRDRERDATRGIRTIPVAIGVARSKQLVGVALVGHLWLKTIHYYPAHPAMLVPAVLTVAYACLLLAGLSARRGDVYYSLLWDGTILLQAVLAVGFAPR